MEELDGYLFSSPYFRVEAVSLPGYDVSLTPRDVGISDDVTMQASEPSSSSFRENHIRLFSFKIKALFIDVREWSKVFGNILFDREKHIKIQMSYYYCATAYNINKIGFVSNVIFFSSIYRKCAISDFCFVG